MFYKSHIAILPMILLLYFPISYFSNLEELREYRIFIQLLFVYFGLIYLLINTKISKYLKDLSMFFVYSLLLTSLLSLTTIFSLNPAHSFSRVVITVILFSLFFIIFYTMHHNYFTQQKWRNYVSYSILVSLLLIIAGQIIIPEWSAGVGGIRLSGGTNANLVAFLALFVIFISHYNVLIIQKWSSLQKVNWLLGVVVLFWSMSRSVIMSFFLFYTIYIIYIAFKDDIVYIVKGRISSKLFKKILYTILASIAIFYAYNHIINLDIYNLIQERFIGREGLSSREYAWEYLMQYFYNNPVFGGVGWYNSSYLLTEFEGADSPHNLFVRLLAESGALGLISILILPVTIIVGLYLKKSQNGINVNESKVIILTFSFLIAIYAGQYFEDRYLVGFMNMSNSIFIWTLALGVFLIKKAPANIFSENNES